MKRETLDNNQITIQEIMDTVEGTVSELQEAAAAGGGLGGAAHFAEKLERQKAALREFAEKQEREKKNENRD